MLGLACIISVGLLDTTQQTLDLHWTRRHQANTCLQRKLQSHSHQKSLVIYFIVTHITCTGVRFMCPKVMTPLCKDYW